MTLEKLKTSVFVVCEWLVGLAVHQGLSDLSVCSDLWSHLFGRLYLNMVMSWRHSWHVGGRLRCCHTCLYWEGMYTWQRRACPVRHRKSRHSKKTPRYPKLSRNKATVGSVGFKCREQGLEAEGVAASGDVQCLCQSGQQTVNTVTCQTFRPWTINGTSSH